MKHPFCVGLTGGIGSGKSVVSDAFTTLGVRVVDTDVIARELTSPAGAALPALIAQFGPDCLAADGSLDRTKMREKIFHVPSLRTRLESILHPLIRDEAARQINATHLHGSPPYVLLVVPLLIESMPAYAHLIDRILVVDCDIETQRSRVQQRNAMPKDTLDAILACQVDRQTRLRYADDILDNNGDLALLKNAVSRLNDKYLHFAAQSEAV